MSKDKGGGGREGGRDRGREGGRGGVPEGSEVVGCPSLVLGEGPALPSLPRHASVFGEKSKSLCVQI